MVWYSNAEGRHGANGAKGDQGEEIVEEYCLKNSIPFEPKKDYHSQVVLKIDYIINGIPVDVKSNYYQGMLAVELYQKTRNQAGWLYTTTSKQIYGVDVDTKSIYRYNIDDMIEYVSNNKHRAKRTKKGDIIMWVPVKTSFIEHLQ